MHAYLITGATPQERGERAQIIFEKESAEKVITLTSSKRRHLIEGIRGLQRKLSFKPLSGQKRQGVLIEDAHLLTQDAANSFLKTLEEPPGDTIIILTAPSRELLLETISSRASHIDLGASVYEISQEEKEEAESALKNLLSAKLGERLSHAEQIKNREEALRFCIGQIFAVRELLLEGVRRRESNSKQLVQLLERLEKARQDLEANTNVKLAVGDLLLNYPRATIPS